jgi:HEAT repeat-containing protein 5
MQAKDTYILAAMDGKEPADGPPVDVSRQPARDDPVAFFYVVFGLVYETLASSSPESSSNALAREASVIAALQTLKCLVRPEYAGTAILEPTIFDEFISMSYRLAMIEGAAVQIHLVEMLAIFAATQDRATDASVDVLAVSSPRTHCLRICSHILRQATAGRGAFIRESHSPIIFCLRY